LATARTIGDPQRLHSLASATNPVTLHLDRKADTDRTGPRWPLNASATRFSR
jgi:hypothetical protein